MYIKKILISFLLLIVCFGVAGCENKQTANTKQNIQVIKEDTVKNDELEKLKIKYDKIVNDLKKEKNTCENQIYTLKNDIMVLKENNKKIEIPDIDISDWETYKNEEYGFKIKYPQDWILSDEKFNEDVLISLKTQKRVDDLENYKTVRLFDLYISVRDFIKTNNENLTFEEWGDNHELNKDTSTDILKYRELSCDNAVFCDDYIYTENNGKLYKIIVDRTGMKEPEIEIEKIISTFEFIK